MDRKASLKEIHYFLLRGIEGAKDLHSIADYALASANYQTDAVMQAEIRNAAATKLTQLQGLNLADAKELLVNEMARLAQEKLKK